jgi:hypothetical protein
MRLTLDLRLRHSSAFALVITLIMVTLAAVLVISLLSSASLERTTAKSVDDRYQAEVAVGNGLEAAKKVLAASPDASNSVTASDTFLVTRIDAPAVPLSPASPVATASYYFLGKAQAGNASKIDYYPLFAGGSPTTGATINLAAGAPQPPVTRPTPPPNPNPGSAGTAAIETDGGKTKIIKAYPQVSSWIGAPSTQWIEIPDPNDTATAPNHNLPYQRYTYWIEDLAGYLDASQVGNENGGSSKHQRLNGTNSNEIALFTIFDQAQPADSGSTLAKNLIDGRPLLFTVPTLPQIAPPPSGQPDLAQPNLAVRYGTDTGGEQELVPFGYGYSNEGQPKTDLNQLIANKNVASIASAITTAMPNFNNRAGGHSAPFDYLKNIAANIVDYADASKAPTTDGSTYRGIGAFPFLVSAFDLNNWVDVTGGPPGDYFVSIEVTTYIQLWNPHNIPVSGNLSVHYENVDQLNINGNPESYTPPPDYNDTSFSLGPNEYRVIILPQAAPGASPQPQAYSYDWGPTPPATSGPTPSQSFIPFPKDTTANTIRVTWNGKLADQPRANMGRSLAAVGMRFNSNKAFSRAAWRGNAAPPIYPNTGAPGDARISYYLNLPWTVANYDTNSSWGGRLWLKGVPIEMQPSQWPDGGHDSTKGINPSNAVTPDKAAKNVTPAYSPTSSDAKMWVSYLSTKGSLETLSELGHVFDPSQWKYQIPTTNASTSLPDIPTSAVADAKQGGGYTLCIGRPEFSKFDTNGQRAWQLLDVFALASRFDSRGRLNLNTASDESLRALAAGLVLDRDPAVVPAGTLYPPKSNNTARECDLFAQAVVNSRPLLSPAQLQTISNSIGPFFGNPKQWTNETASSTSSASPTEWNDPGREELFSKIFNLTTVRSRNFRVFVTGQSLDKNGKVLSTVSKVFQVFLKPTRNTTTGAIQSEQTAITYEALL